MEVYLDLFFILNFAVDFLLILGTNRLSGFGLGARRAALAAAGGALYAAACLLPGFLFLGNLFWRLVALTGMSVIAFGWRRNAVRRTVLFVFLNMALGGIASGMGNGGFWAIILGALGAAILCTVGFCGYATEQKYVDVSISHGNRKLRMTALRDSGNTLRDPISGLPVLVADATVGRELLDLSTEALQDPIETMHRIGNRGLRLIPYRAIGQPSGMLLGLRADSVEINGKKEDVIVAFAPQAIGNGKPYQALAGGSMG